MWVELNETSPHFYMLCTQLGDLNVKKNTSDQLVLLPLWKQQSAFILRDIRNVFIASRSSGWFILKYFPSDAYQL